MNWKCVCGTVDNAEDGQYCRSCGASRLQEKNASQIAARFSDSSQPSSKRRLSRKVLFIVVGVGVVLALWNALHVSRETTSTPPATDVSSFATSVSSPILPSSEGQFIAIVLASQHNSSQAENDMQRGGIKSIRDEGICRILSGNSLRAENWIGTVTKIDSNSDGKGVLALSIAKDITLKTWNNAISDIGNSTLIEPRTELFQTASLLKEGQRVVFSGIFIPKQEGCIEESSMTLRGKLDEPEFIFRFSAVALYTPTASASVEDGAVRSATSHPAITVLGFTSGEPPHDAGIHAIALGMKKFVSCNVRKDSSEYDDCKFLGSDQESIEASFLHGQLQRVSYRFGLDRYDEVLQKIEKTQGTPRALMDPHDSSYEVSKEWGGYKEGFSISLQKTVNPTGQFDGADAEIVF